MNWPSDPDMIIAVDWDIKQQTKPNQTMGESSKFLKSWTFEIQNLTHAVWAIIVQLAWKLELCHTN